MASKGIISAGHGISNAFEVSDAVKAAIRDAGVSEPTVAFINCNVKHDAEKVQAAFKKELPGVILHGITGNGGVLTLDGTKNSSIGCLLVEASRGSIIAANSMDGDVNAVVDELFSRIDKPRTIFMSTTPGQEEGVLEAIRKKFGTVPVYGGTAADNDLSGKWSVISHHGVSGKGISLVAFSTDVTIGASFGNTSYKRTDNTIVANKTEGRRVFEINGKPAADWTYAFLGDGVKKEYEEGGLILGPTADKPVSIILPSGEFVNGHLAAFGDKRKGEGFVDFFIPVPAGSQLAVLEAGDGPKTGYNQSLRDCYDASLLSCPKPKAAILVYCGGMAIACGDSIDNGLKGKVNEVVSKDTAVLGFTCFGEQGYLPANKKSIQMNLSVGFFLMA